MKDIRLFLNLRINNKDIIFTIMRNGVRKSLDNGQIHMLTFKEAYELLLNMESCQVIGAHPDFWETLEFRAKEYGNR